MRITTRRKAEQPGPKPCPHCGAVRPTRTADLCGRSVFVGWEPCQCPGAQEERAAYERGRAREAHASEVAAWSRKLERAAIPPKYREAVHPWAQRMAQRIAEGQGFYIHGPNGTGKTTLACAAALICLRGGMSVRFAVATKLLDALREFGAESRGLAEGLAKCDLLVIDDLGKEGAAAPRAAEKLFNLFNDRANEATLAHPKPVIVTSNFPRGNVAAAVSEGGAGIAIASRLAEMTEVVPMEGEDWRLKNGQSAKSCQDAYDDGRATWR